MGKKTERVNHRLVIEPPDPGDFGIVRLGGVDRSTEETVRILNEMRDQVIRHVDGVVRGQVRIESDREVTCEFCGSAWTEGDSPHNGGCCEKDEEVMLADVPVPG